ncbi:hypothetical protein [Mangrovicella endophytica]|uniref:hypothetical protein n=1 Tax=Mangrovicella endophytica TaxID=2066697 RepID=UPI00130010BD
MEMAAEIAGKDAVNTAAAPLMGGEDFSYMLERAAGSLHLHWQRRLGSTARRVIEGCPASLRPTQRAANAS